METQAAAIPFCFNPAATAVAAVLHRPQTVYTRALIVLHAWLMAADNVSDSRKTNKRHRPLDYRVPVSTKITHTYTVRIYIYRVQTPVLSVVLQQ